MLTVGFDFGTHQTKICIEKIDGVEHSYEFFQFTDPENKKHYTLPSIIWTDHNGLLHYGYMPQNKIEERPITEKEQHKNLFSWFKSIFKKETISEKEKKGEIPKKIIRYFKQATFTNFTYEFEENEYIYYSIWYIAYILFDLEEIYNKEFAIQMGIPTDSTNFETKKKLAVRILLSAYELVENVFENNKQLFLSTNIDQLKTLTNIIEYDEKKKLEFGILIFPEAYAGLLPLTYSNLIANGMSLLIDIGGGTTDISFFTLQNNLPQIYFYTSINMGLNYLTNSNNALDNSPYINQNAQIVEERFNKFTEEINTICSNLVSELLHRFPNRLARRRLYDALQNRPIIYIGGGSSFNQLCNGYNGFNSIIHISEQEWRSELIPNQQIKQIRENNLFKILSTSYGLSIAQINDDIKLNELKTIFDHIQRALNESENDNIQNRTNLYEDWDAIH